MVQETSESYGYWEQDAREQNHAGSARQVIPPSAGTYIVLVRVAVVEVDLFCLVPILAAICSALFHLFALRRRRKKAVADTQTKQRRIRVLFVVQEKTNCSYSLKALGSTGGAVPRCSFKSLRRRSRARLVFGTTTMIWDGSEPRIPNGLPTANPQCTLKSPVLFTC